MDSTAKPAPQHRATGESDLAEVERRLVAAVRRTCPSWLAGDADDLVQAALIKLTEARGPGEGIEALSSSYLWRVAYSAVIDEIRRRRRRREVSLDEEVSTNEPAADGPDPEQRLGARHIGAGIIDCLRGLPAERRQAVTLRLLGHPVRDVASLLGCNDKRADNLVYRGLADLRECLRRKGLEP